MPEAQVRNRVLAERPLLVASAAGLLYYLGFSPLSWWPLTFLGVACLIFLLDAARTPREAAGRAMLWKAVALMPAVPYLSGLGISVHVVAVGAHVLCWGLMGASFAWTRRKAGAVAALVSLPALWTLAEWLGTVRHFLPSHVTTWSQALAAPAISVAPYTGALGVSTVAVALAALPCVLLRRGKDAPLAVFGYALLFAMPLAGRLAYGPAPEPVGPPLRVATFSLMANDAMEEYLGRGEWTDQRARSIETYIGKRVTRFRELLAGMVPDLVVLPEDALDFVLPQSRSAEAHAKFGIENNGLLIDAYRELARSVGAPVAIGLTTIRDGRRFNSTLLIGKDGSLIGLRDKWKLTPGSEYWPAAGWLPVYALFAGDRQYVDPDRQYSRPKEPFPPMLLGDLTVGASTCLEGHMPTMYLGWRQAGAELLLFLGNAHWFHWDPGTFNIQLLRTVRVSAAAYGLPVVMTGKANYAGAIEPDGSYRVWSWVLDGGSEEAHEVLVRLAPPWRTPAVRWGEYFLPVSAALIPLLLLASRVFRRR